MKKQPEQLYQLQVELKKQGEATLNQKHSTPIGVLAYGHELAWSAKNKAIYLNFYAFTSSSDHLTSIEPNGFDEPSAQFS